MGMSIPFRGERYDTHNHMPHAVYMTRNLATDPTAIGIVGLVPWADVGLVGLLTSVIAAGLYGLISGRLIPVSTHDKIVAARDAQLAQMRELYEAERKRGDLLAGQVSVGTEAARTAATAMDALRLAALTPGEGDGR